MISKLTAITPEYMKHRIEEETEQYKQEIEKLREHTSNQDRIIADANNRIYKAIEYIKKETWFNCKDLLKILEGEDNE